MSSKPRRGTSSRERQRQSSSQSQQHQQQQQQRSTSRSRRGRDATPLGGDSAGHAASAGDDGFADYVAPASAVAAATSTTSSRTSQFQYQRRRASSLDHEPGVSTSSVRGGDDGTASSVGVMTADDASTHTGGSGVGGGGATSSSHHHHTQFVTQPPRPRQGLTGKISTLFRRESSRERSGGSNSNGRPGEMVGGGSSSQYRRESMERSQNGGGSNRSNRSGGNNSSNNNTSSSNNRNMAIITTTDLPAIPASSSSLQPGEIMMDHHPSVHAAGAADHHHDVAASSSSLAAVAASPVNTKRSKRNLASSISTAKGLMGSGVRVKKIVGSARSSSAAAAAAMMMAQSTTSSGGSRSPGGGNAGGGRVPSTNSVDNSDCVSVGSTSTRQSKRIFYSSHNDDDSDDSYESRMSNKKGHHHHGRQRSRSANRGATRSRSLNHSEDYTEGGDDDDDDDDEGPCPTGSMMSGATNANTKTIVRYRGFSTSIKSLFLDETVVCASMGCFGLILSNRTEYLLQLRNNRRGVLSPKKSAGQDRKKLPSRIVAYGLLVTIILMFSTFVVWGFGTGTGLSPNYYSQYYNENSQEENNNKSSYKNDDGGNNNNNAQQAADDDGGVYNKNQNQYNQNYNKYNDDGNNKNNKNSYNYWWNKYMNNDDGGAAVDDDDDYFKTADDAAADNNANGAAADDAVATDDGAVAATDDGAAATDDGAAAADDGAAAAAGGDDYYAYDAGDDYYKADDANRNRQRRENSKVQQIQQDRQHRRRHGLSQVNDKTHKNHRHRSSIQKRQHDANSRLAIVEVYHPMQGIFKLRDCQENVWDPIMDFLHDEWNRPQESFGKSNLNETSSKKRGSTTLSKPGNRRVEDQQQQYNYNNGQYQNNNNNDLPEEVRRSRDLASNIRIALLFAFLLFLGVLGRRRRMRTRFYLVRARAQEDHLFYASTDVADGHRRVNFDDTREDQYEGACSHTLCGCYPTDEVIEAAVEAVDEEVEVTDNGIFKRKRKPYNEDFVARTFNCLLACCCGWLCKCWFQCLSICALAQEAREVRLLVPPRYQRIDFITHQPFHEYQKEVNDLRRGWLGKTRKKAGLRPHYMALSRLSRYIVITFLTVFVILLITLIFNPRAAFSWQDAVVVSATFVQAFLVLFIVHWIFHKSDLSLDAVIKMFAAGFIIAVPAAFFFEALLVNINLCLAWICYEFCAMLGGETFEAWVFEHWRVIWFLGELFNAYVVAAVTEELCKYYTFRAIEHPDLVFLTGLNRNVQDDDAVDGGLVKYPFASHQVSKFNRTGDSSFDNQSVHSHRSSASDMHSSRSGKSSKLIERTGTRDDEFDEDENDVRTYRQKAMAITTGMISVAVGLACAENFLYVFILGGAQSSDSADEYQRDILEQWIVLFFRSIFPIHALAAALQSISMIRKFVEGDDQNGHRIGVGRIIFPAVVLHGSFDAILMGINVYQETAWEQYMMDQMEENGGNVVVPDEPPYNTLVVNLVAWIGITVVMFAGLGWYYRENRNQRLRLKILEEKEKAKTVEEDAAWSAAAMENELV